MTESTEKRTGRSDLKNLIIIFLLFYFSIMFWELFLYSNIHGSQQGFSTWTPFFACAEAMFFTFLSGWFKNRTVNRIIQIVLLVLIWIYYTSQIIYFKIFGSMYSVYMAGMAGNAIQNFSWTLISVVKRSWGIILGGLTPVIIVVLFMIIFKPEPNYSPKLHIASFLLTIAVWAAAVLLLPTAGTGDNSAYAAYHGNYTDTDTSSARLGILANAVADTGKLLFGADSSYSDLPEPSQQPDDRTDPDSAGVQDDPNVERNILEQIDFSGLASKAQDADTRQLCLYMNGTQGTAKNDMTGLFEGYNLIYICGEAFSSYAINEKLTPTLYKLANEGIVLNNYYNSFKNVTTNGEYAFLNGLWPDLSYGIYAGDGTTVGSFPQSVKRLMPMGMGTLFNQQCGTLSRAYHNYLGYYYGRNQYLPNIGFTCKFMGEGMFFSEFWPSSDWEMMLQSVDDYINDDRFCAYYMTFSGHGEYNFTNGIYNKNILTVMDTLGETDLTPDALGYLACNYELEKAMTYLLEKLDKAGKLDNTVIVLAGDHTPYSLSQEGVNSIAGHEVDYDFEIYKNTCIIWNGGLKKPIYVDEPCCNVDIYPTILNLFGLDYDSRLMAGHDIFSNSQHMAVLYNKSFVTSEVTYNSTTGTAVWDENNDWTQKKRDLYLNSCIANVRNSYAMCLKMEQTDFYRFVWENTDW